MAETAQHLREGTQDPPHGRGSMNDGIDKAGTPEKLICYRSHVVVD